MTFTITYIRTLTLEETIEAATLQEAEQYAQARAWESCKLLNADFADSDTDFEVSEAIPGSETKVTPLMVESTS